MRFFWFALFLTTLPLRAADVIVFAAASLSDAVEEIARDFEQRQSGNSDNIVFNFGSSSTLARQIREGAPAGIFISADEAQMDILDSRGILVPGTRRILLTNKLVVVVAAAGGGVHPGAITAPADLLDPAIRRLALGEPNTVPAGVYARVWLTRLGLWEKLVATGKIIPCDNVRAALAAVESGNASAAIVYATDARISAKVRVALQAAGTGAPAITYPAALIKNTRNSEAARRFFDYLVSPAATRIFEKHGFGAMSPRA